jgi:hypothetical protein
MVLPSQRERNRILIPAFIPIFVSYENDGATKPLIPLIPFEIGAGEGNRTLVCSLEDCRSTIELRPHAFCAVVKA